MVTPKKRILYRYAVDIFIALLKQVQQGRTVYRCNDNDVNAWNKFIDYYKDVYVGEEFIKTFAKYGIQCWFSSKNSDAQKYLCRFSWVFSSAMIKRWNTYGAEKNIFITRKNLNSYALKGSKIKSELSNVYTQIRASEEGLKQRYHNKKRGMDWCIANTSLYFHRSTLCASCVYKMDCKKTLKENYPKIYKLRGYDE